jgi:transposase
LRDGELVGMRGSPKSGKRRSPGGPRPPWWKLDDAVWERLEPLLVDPPRRFCNAGRKRYSARVCLEGVLYLLYTGMRYVDLPRELGFPSGETCRRRLHEWIDSGVWPLALALLVSELDQKGRLDWSRVVVDASIVDAKKGATGSGRAPSTGALPQPSITWS